MTVVISGYGTFIVFVLACLLLYLLKENFAAIIGNENDSDPEW